MKMVPRRRFKGFNEEWEERRLGELGKTFTGLSCKTKKDFGHGDAEFVTYLNTFNNTLSDIKQTESVELDEKQNEVQYGDIFFTTSSETPEEVGMSSVWLDNRPNVYLNSFCFGYRTIEEVNPYYMAYMLRSPGVRKEFQLLAQGISRYNISKNRAMNIPVPMPKPVEQQRLGYFFTNLDNLITLHQRKFEKLQALKKAYLVEMFPQEGEKVPRRRFEGFNDPWEERRLGEIVERVSTSSVHSSLLLIEYKDVVSGQGRLVKDFRFNENKKKGIEFKTGDILFGYLRPYLDNRLIARFNGIAVGDWWVLRSEKGNSKFIYCLMQTQKFRSVANLSTGTKMPRADWSTVESSRYLIPPDVEEQQRIGAFFTHLDNLITLHQRKLEKLQTLKKAYLSEMFV